MVQRRALPLPPRLLLLLLVALLPALASAAAPTSADPLAAVAESPSLPRELLARVRASGAELAAAGLAPLAAAAVDARGGGDALARTLASTRAAVLALCGSAAVLERSADDTAPRADEAPAPPATAALLEDAEKNAALFHWLAVELDAALAVAPAAPASPTARREGGTRSLADELREARAVLAARLETFPSSSTSSTSSTSSSSNSGFSCYRWSGYIARSLAARNALSLPFDELVEATSTWSDAELDACGLRHARLAFLAAEKNERNNAAAAAAGGNDSRDHLVDGLNLTAFGAVVETCRVGGGNGLTQLVGPGAATQLAATKLSRLKSHLSAMDASLRRRTAMDGFTCLSDASLAPAMDDEADAPPGARLATATALVSFLAGAAEDVLVSDGGCERARESSSTGAYYPVAVFDGIAQELAQCGIGDAYGRAWLRARYPNGGTAGLASRLDQVAAAVDACEGSSDGADVKDAQSPPLTRVDLDALAATIRRFRSADAAMFGCRRGAYAHSAAGRLADALDGYRAVLASCPTATADAFVPTSFDPTNFDPTEPHPEIVHPSSSSYVVIPVTEAAGGGVGSRRVGFEPGGGAGFVGVVSASCVLAAGGVAFCVARYLQTRRDRSVRGPWRKMGSDDDLGRPPRAPSGVSGVSGVSGRAPFAFSARKFYRHLQAGSVGDLPLVEDLDRASGVSTESEGNDRVGTPPSAMGNVVDLPSPRYDRRSNSISEPATRPPPAGVRDDLVLRGFAGGISEPKPRHPSRHSTPYHGLRSAGELRVNIPVGAFRETADGRRPTTPPAGASGAHPFFDEKRLTHP